MEFKLIEKGGPDGIEGTLILWSGSREIGCCRFNYNSEFEKGYIHDLRINDGFTRRGYGRAIINEVEKYFAANGIKYINGIANALEPSKIGKRNLRDWWKNLGYTVHDANTSEESNCIGGIFKELAQQAAGGDAAR